MRLVSGDVETDLRPEAGGRIGQITVSGVPLLRGEAESDGSWASWGSYPLAPWSNRIPGGRFRFDGVEHRVPVNWSDGSALHGLVADRPWHAEETDAGARMWVAVEAGPFAVTVHQSFTLDPLRLQAVLAVENRGRPLPMGLGIHPWFRYGELTLPADAIWPSEGAIPTGPPRPLRPAEDLRRGRRPPVLDHAYTHLTGTRAEMGAVALEWDGPVTCVVVFTGVPGWMTVEPVTHANDGYTLLARGDPRHGLRVLETGESMTLRYRFTWR